MTKTGDMFSLHRDPNICVDSSQNVLGPFATTRPRSQVVSVKNSHKVQLPLMLYGLRERLDVCFKGERAVFFVGLTGKRAKCSPG